MSDYTKLTALFLMFDIIQLFCVIDDFFLKFKLIYWKFIKQNFQHLRHRAAQLSISEIIFIAVWYKCSHFNKSKALFTSLKLDKNYLFKQLPYYQCMIHLINMHQLALHVLHFALMKDQQSSYLWINSTI